MYQFACKQYFDSTSYSNVMMSGYFQFKCIRILQILQSSTDCVSGSNKEMYYVDFITTFAQMD
jgi:hypothetical protein